MRKNRSSEQHWKTSRSDRAEGNKHLPDLPRVPSELVDTLEAEFQRIFRRPPGEGDPLFFPFALLMSEDEVGEKWDEIMAAAGTDPALQHAIRKTGRVVSDVGKKYLSAEDLKEWNDAVAEFRTWEQSGFPIHQPSHFEQAANELEEEFVRLQFVMALFLRQANDPSTPPSSNRLFAFFYAAKSLKSMLASNVILFKGYAEDSMTLARSTFENYLQTVFAVRRPSDHGDWAMARLGIESGKWRYPTNRRGRYDYSMLVEVATGREITQLTRGEMARLSPFPEDRELYKLLYGHLSSYAHPDPIRLLNYLSEDGFVATKREDAGPAHLLAMLILTLQFDALLNLGDHPARPRRDVQVLLDQIRLKSTKAFSLVQNLNQYALAGPLKSRMEKVGLPWP
ncbi:MAG: hypothetical protein L0211_21035 [Planctomycetaceae bacterium]|nr:hypothetical protein [Planctomycetaceae bacterium]